ncbi:MAG TPA: ATP-binding cassette domain-containing protein, partial [Acidimicrobiia bacterium]|nr:ATP-binding cassette domain-containing protein [Acidimicrobiia bacterium]
MKALELDGVHAGYGRTRVLRGVDLSLPAGSTVALLGANGAGKTTLLRVAAGLLPASGGTVRLGGRPAPAGADSRARAGLCLVPEGRGIFPRLTVEENVALFAGGRRRRDDAFDHVVAIFPVLGQRRRQVAGTMSGGQQQMLAFSRALCTDAPVVLADELSFGLAPIVLDELFEAVAGLRADGRSVLVVEQFVDRVLGLA